MKFIRICKNKKVISIVLSIIVLSGALILGKGSTNQEPTRETFKSASITQESQSNRVRKELNINGVAKQKTMKGKKLRVGATAYTNDPITSTGTKPTEGVTIAVDPNVIPYGTRVYIPQLDTIFIAEDCGSAIKGNRIDIYMDDYNKCMEWGYRDITIIVLP